jgi:8-oxo-dGTP diphosphatase
MAGPKSDSGAMAVPVYLVRHAHAQPREGWRGSDKHRPLTDRGAKEAVALTRRFDVSHSSVGPGQAPSREHRARGLEPRPTLLVSSSAERCLATLRPRAAACELPIVIAGFLSEGSDANEAFMQMKDLAASGGVPVFCSHGDVIWGIVDILRAAGTGFDAQVDVKKGSVLILEMRSGSVESARYIPPDKV